MLYFTTVLLVTKTSKVPYSTYLTFFPLLSTFLFTFLTIISAKINESRCCTFFLFFLTTNVNRISPLQNGRFVTCLKPIVLLMIYCSYFICSKLSTTYLSMRRCGYRFSLLNLCIFFFVLFVGTPYFYARN